MGAARHAVALFFVVAVAGCAGVPGTTTQCDVTTIPSGASFAVGAVGTIRSGPVSVRACLGKQCQSVDAVSHRGQLTSRHRSVVIAVAASIFRSAGPYAGSVVVTQAGLVVYRATGKIRLTGNAASGCARSWQGKVRTTPAGQLVPAIG